MYYQKLTLAPAEQRVRYGLALMKDAIANGADKEKMLDSINYLLKQLEEFKN